MEQNIEQSMNPGDTAVPSTALLTDVVGQTDTANDDSVDEKPAELSVEQVACLRRDLERARREAAEASRTRSRFLAIMSHEMRTPLNGVLGALQLLADSNPVPPQLELIDLARSSAEQMRRITNDVIDLSRLETGRLELEFAPFDIAALLDEICEFWRPMAVSKGLTLQLTVDDTLPREVSGDAVRIRQLVTHYLSNAINFTEQGSVRVGLGLDGGSSRADVDDFRVRLEVSDTGPGIPRDEQKSLFRGYSSIQDANAGQRGGAGLGLAICREIAGLMGGSVGVRSVPGQGSTFWVSLPLRAAVHPVAEGNAPGTSGEAPPLLTAEGIAPTILLVEDSVTNQMIAQAFLERQGCRVDIANDGLEAVNAVKARRYDVVLMDVAMPRMDGVEATRQIRALPGEMARVPIVGQTAHALEEDARMFLSAGMDQVVNKPLQRQALFGALSAALTSATSRSSTLPAPGAYSSSIDTTVLGDLRDSLETHQFEQLLERLIEDIDANGKEAVAGANKGDLGRLARASHTLKGLGASFGSPELESLASAIQTACRNDDAPQATAMALSRLETVCANSLAALTSFQRTISVRSRPRKP